MTTQNKYGFPTELCSRCKGTGEHSYNQRFGTVCFKCGGDRYVVTKKASDAWALYIKAIETAKKPQGKDLKVSDLIAHNKVWREIAEISITPKATGWTITRGSDGTEVSTPWAYEMTITLGATTNLPQETMKVSTNQIMRRHSKNVDPAPFLDQVRQTARMQP